MHWSVRTDNASQLHLPLSSLPLPIALQLATASWLAEMAWNGQAVAFRLDWWLRQGEKGRWTHVWYVCVAAGGSCLATVKPKMHCAFWRIYKSPAGCLPACLLPLRFSYAGLIKDIKKYIRYMFHMCSISFIYIFFYNFHIHTIHMGVWLFDSGSLRWIYFSFLLYFAKASSTAGAFNFWSRLVWFSKCQQAAGDGEFSISIWGHCLCANLFAIILARIS